jgi:tetratricopeptide (TPR) repeat protein
VRSNFGAALATAGRYEEAIAQFRAALQLNPGLEEAQKNLAQAQQLLATSKGSGRSGR